MVRTGADVGPAAPPAPVAPAPAPAPAPEAGPIRDLLPGLCVVGALTHVAFLTLFLLTGVQVLAAVNIASIACYLIVLALVRRRDTKPIVVFSILGAEIFGHSVTASIVIGWDSGFHYYILLLVPIAAVSTIHPSRLKVAAVASAVLGYVGADLWLRPATAPVKLPGGTMPFVYYFNLMSALLILAVLAGQYYLLVDRAQTALRVIATIDPLTELRNRSSLTEVIQHQHSRSQRGHQLSFIMCDIDNFKSVNDRGGHAAGDAVLQSVSRSLASSVRDVDFIGRWGGEEFLVVLPDAAAAEAAVVAERLRNDVTSLPVLIQGGPARITVTIGVATVGPGESATKAIARADSALYDGKRAGRNRVVASNDTPIDV